MFRLLKIAIFRLYTNPEKVVIQDLMCAVYSGIWGMRWARDLVLVMKAGEGGWVHGVTAIMYFQEPKHVVVSYIVM